ncbi:MAG: DinB family protein [Gemmatimonadetes bacterium]|nr:DinB family protein [Gemmatimonadota bacterium]
MSDVEAVLAANRAAILDLIAAGEESGAAWTTPRAPGKWSPSQVVEHVARSLEEGAHVVAGEPSSFPTLPRLVRPVLRGLFFNRVLKTGRFPKARTSRALDPERGPASPQEGRGRLDDAMARFEQACRSRAATGQPVSSTVFGTVSVVDYARFTEVHTRHHTRQIPV